MSSAIVRELVTVLGFKTDLKGIKEGEKALLSFTTKFALAASATLLALSKTMDFFGDIANDTVAAGNLARATGIALENLLGMQRAAAQFGLRSKDISGIFEKINDLGRSALLGQGELLKLAEETGIQYKDNNGELLSNEQIFRNILRFLGKIDNERERLRIASLIFGKEFAQGISDISQNLDKFTEDSKKYAEGVKDQVADQEKAAKAYAKSIIDLENAWSNFARTISQYVFPLLEGLLKILTALIDATAFLVTPLVKGVKALAHATGEELTRDIRDDTEYNEAMEFRKNVEEGKFSLWNIFGLPSPDANQPNAIPTGRNNNITANVDVTVAAGASIADAQQMGQIVADEVAKQMDYTINQIYNNNPQVE